MKKIKGTPSQMPKILAWKGGTKKYRTIATLDNKNAFNSPQWSKIPEAMRKQKEPVYKRKDDLQLFLLWGTRATIITKEAAVKGLAIDITVIIVRKYKEVMALITDEIIHKIHE